MIKRKINNLRLSEAMEEFNIIFKKGQINILNTPPASGKSYFIYKKFLKDLKKYLEGFNTEYPTIYYLVDTTTLKDAIENELENEGIKNIKLMTYAKFSKNLNIENSIIICDEYQNLYNYLRYNWNKKEECYEGCYIDIIKNLNNLCVYNWIIGLSGTDFDIYNKKLPDGIKVNNKNMFTEAERKYLKTYNYEPIYVNCIFNYIKSVNWSKKKDKVLLNTRTIKQAKKYKSFFDMIGVNCEWICSIRAEKEEEWKGYDSLTEQQKEMVDCGLATVQELMGKVEEKDGKLVKKKKVMTKTQEQLRKYVIDNKEFPKDLQVLIVNGAYETGWNLESEKGQKNLIQTVIIDNTNIGYCMQSRYRVRHDIETLILLCTHYEQGWEEDDNNYYVLNRNQYGEYKEGDYMINNETGIVQKVRDYRDTIIDLPDNFLGVKLNTKMKNEIVDLVGKLPLGKKDTEKEVNWKNTQKDLEFSGYIIDITKNGSFIYRNILDKNTEENINTLIDWFENEWDKGRVSEKDVRDELDLGRKSWEKMFKSHKLISYMKTQRITKCTIKGLGKTLYFMKN